MESIKTVRRIVWRSGDDGDLMMSERGRKDEKSKGAEAGFFFFAIFGFPRKPPTAPHRRGTRRTRAVTESGGGRVRFSHG